MKTLVCKTARNLLLKSAVASLAATLSVDAIAQPTPAEVEEQVEYAQCIRANGYAEFPDPGPDGGWNVRIVSSPAAEQFQAAQRACTDKLPSGIAAMNAPMTPERLEGLVKFAECVRAAGISGFPDPTPRGDFQLTDPAISPASPQVQQAMATCRESTGATGGRFIMRPQQ